MDNRIIDDFRLTAMLCDSVQAVGGKLYILGGGWTQIPAQPIQTAIAIAVSIPWNEANKQHQLEGNLVNDSGDPFVAKTRLADGSESEAPFVVKIPFEAGRPPGTRPGSPLSLNLGVYIPALPFAVGRYEWRFSVNGIARDEWRYAFEVKPVQQTVFLPPVKG